MINVTHVVYSVDERVVTAVAHCQPVTAEKYNINITKPKIMYILKFMFIYVDL